jgi:hypothetical protein
MKKVIIYFSVMAASCMLGSCSDLAFGDAFLEKAPGVDVTIDTIFSSKLYADRALNSAYATLRTGLTVHANDGNFEHQQAGNKLGWDNLDALTDIIVIGEVFIRLIITGRIVRRQRIRPQVRKWDSIPTRM